MNKIKSLPSISKYNINKKKMNVRQRIIHNLKLKKESNLILGSGHSFGYNDQSFPDFISTDQDELDLINRFEISQYIPKESITTILANHVLEHIYPEEIVSVFINIHFMQKNNGTLIFCVPDINSYSSQYYNSKDEAIIFQPKASHYILYSYESLDNILHKIGYKTYPIYYHVNNREIYGNNESYNILKEIKLLDYIQRSIKSDPYALCVICKKLGNIIKETEFYD